MSIAMTAAPSIRAGARPREVVFMMLRCAHVEPTPKDEPMPPDAIVRARVSSGIKKQAGAILAESGLTISAAIRMLLARIVAAGALPFDPLPSDLAPPKPIKARANRQVGGGDELLDDLLADPTVSVMPTAI
jgi:DNA-damage-inducible protein J